MERRILSGFVVVAVCLLSAGMARGYDDNGIYNIFYLDEVIHNFGLVVPPYTMGDHTGDGLVGSGDYAAVVGGMLKRAYLTEPGVISVSSVGEATYDKPGWVTHTVEVKSSGGPVTSVGLIVESPSGLGQVNPFDQITIINDLDPGYFMAAGGDIRQDTHFLIHNDQGQTAMTMPDIEAGNAWNMWEGPEHLSGAFTAAQPDKSILPFTQAEVVQVVIPETAQARLKWWFVVDHTEVIAFDAQLGGLLSADLDGDGEVGLVDLDLLGQYWDEYTAVNPAAAIADADGNGHIGLVDLDLMGKQWGLVQVDTTMIIPEPGVLGLMGVGAVWGLRRR